MSKTLRSTLFVILLACGATSSTVYVVTDVVGAVTYPGYNYAAQAISEMSAIGAPTAELLAPYYRLFSILFLAFAGGVWWVGQRQPELRWSAGFMFAVGAAGTGFSLFPMNMRGVERSFSDAMHLVVAVVTMVLLSGAIISGGKAFGRRFRAYSAATVALMLAFFALTLADAAAVAVNAPTPFMGINERISMAAWLLWFFVFSLKLLRERTKFVPNAPGEGISSKVGEVGHEISRRVADAAAQPLCQAGVIGFCVAWWASGLPTDILTATLSIAAITLTQMVLNRQKLREQDDRRRDACET